MNVVAVVLRVVVLDQERRALHAVVVLLPLLGLARPGERDVVEAGLLQLLHPLGGDVGGHVAGVDVDQRHQLVALRRGHRRRLEAERRLRVRLQRVRRQHLVRRGRVDDRGRLLRRVERLEQRPRRVLFRPEDTRAARSRAGHVDTHFGGIRAEEARRARRQRAVDDVEADRDVVPFEPPAPRFLVAGRAEHAELIRLVIARELPARPLDRFQDVLELHDRRAVVKPRALRPVFSSSHASARCASDISLIWTPLRGNYSLGTKCQRIRSSESNANVARCC